MYRLLEDINHRPEPFSVYTAADLWTDEHTSAQMLQYHLNGDLDVSSRNRTFLDASAAWITDRFALGQGSRVADFGCGPGLYCSRLAKSGAMLTGIDFSERSIAYARNHASENGLEIEYVRRNYLEYETDSSFDLIIMIMCDFCALSPDQRKIMLEKFRNSLKPEGSILLDVNSYHAYDKRSEQAVYEVNQLNGFWAPEKYYGFVNTFKYDREKVMLDKYTIVLPDETRTVYNWFQHFTPDSLKEEFRACGLEIKEQYSDVAGRPFREDGDEFAVVAGIAPYRHPA